MVADNVAAVLGGRRARRFRYRTLGVFVDMGRHKAVATMLGVRLRGFVAWFAAYHMLMMPRYARRLVWPTGRLDCSSAARRPSSDSSASPSLGTYLEREARAGNRR